MSRAWGEKGKGGDGGRGLGLAGSDANGSPDNCAVL